VVTVEPNFAVLWWRAFWKMEQQDKVRDEWIRGYVS
jgi:hypothetical protein